MLQGGGQCLNSTCRWRNDGENHFQMCEYCVRQVKVWSCVFFCKMPRLRMERNEVGCFLCVLDLGSLWQEKEKCKARLGLVGFELQNKCVCCSYSFWWQGKKCKKRPRQGKWFCYVMFTNIVFWSWEIQCKMTSSVCSLEWQSPINLPWPKVVFFVSCLLIKLCWIVGYVLKFLTGSLECIQQVVLRNGQVFF